MRNMSHIPWPKSLGCEYPETPSEGPNPLCLSPKVKYVLLERCLQLRKSIDYEHGWGYSKLRCSPEHLQPKDMGIFCLLGWLQMTELLCQTLYSCYLLASVSGLLILLNVLFKEHRYSVAVYILEYVLSM